ncbi:MAG TPA: DUF503 domain-containing protein [Gemmataceae bacterium]
MVVGTLRVRMLVREARSLKDKRQVVRGIIDRLRHRYNISIGEVGARDDPRRVELGAAAVGAEATPVRTALEQVREDLRRHPTAEYLGGELEIL